MALQQLCSRLQGVEGETTVTTLWIQQLLSLFRKSATEASKFCTAAKTKENDANSTESRFHLNHESCGRLSPRISGARPYLYQCDAKRTLSFSLWNVLAKLLSPWKALRRYSAHYHLLKSSLDITPTHTHTHAL